MRLNESQNIIAFKVSGVAQAKGNMRASKYSRRGKLYDSNKKLHSWTRTLSLQASKHKPKNIWIGPVRLEIRIGLPKPSDHPKTKLWWHVKKPDLDKVLRGIKDPLTGIIYRDDSQVVSVSIDKTYSNEPYVEIRAIQLDEVIKNDGVYTHRKDITGPGIDH